MPIVKFFNARNLRIETLKKCINYVNDKSKTRSDLIGGYGVDKTSVFEDMMLIKLLHRKQDGRQHIHFVCSYETKNTITIDTVKIIATEIGSYFGGGYQINWATHLDTDHYHTHFVLNTVNVYTGLKYSQSRSDMKKFKQFVNQVFESHSLTLIEDFEIYDIDDEAYDVYEDDLHNNYTDDDYNELFTELEQNEIVVPHSMVSFEMVYFEEKPLPTSMVSFDLVYFDD